MTLSDHHIHYFISYAVAFLVFGFTARWYLWPAIKDRDAASRSSRARLRHHRSALPFDQGGHNSGRDVLPPHPKWPPGDQSALTHPLPPGLRSFFSVQAGARTGLVAANHANHFLGEVWVNERG